MPPGTRPGRESNGLTPRAFMNAVLDQSRYLAVLISLIAMSFLYMLQIRELQHQPAWIGWLLAGCWLVLLAGFFVWAAHLLLHRRVAARDRLPGALFTVLGLIGLRVASSFVLANWLTSYSTSYGALGIVMAIFFWIIIGGTISSCSPPRCHQHLRNGAA